MKQCSICDEIQCDGESFGAHYSAMVSRGATHLAVTEDVIVVPSVGALNKSHVMVVPRRHICSWALASGQEARDAAYLVAELEKWAKRKHGWNIVLFEHGSGTSGESAVACVEHAHLHVVRSVRGLGDSILSEMPWKPISGLPAARSEPNTHAGYLYFQDEDGRAYLLNGPNVQPQFFRYVYARAQGSLASWNWRLDYRIGEVINVLAAYDGLKSGSGARCEHS